MRYFPRSPANKYDEAITLTTSSRLLRATWWRTELFPNQSVEMQPVNVWQPRLVIIS
jgi:hypothetical protein